MMHNGRGGGRLSDKFKLDRWLCEILQVFFTLFPDPEFSYEHIYFYI